MKGYVLEMKDMSDFFGVYEEVFDGSDLYPYLRNHLVSGNRIKKANSYVFRVKAKY